MLLSVIIPAYNEEDYLRSTILSIQEGLHAVLGNSGIWEIIVCNNNSTDQTSSIAENLGAKVVDEPINQISRARSTGAAEAKGNWLLFIDADTKPVQNLLNDVYQLMKDGNYLGCGSTMRITGGTKFNKLRLERVNPIMRLFKLAAGSFILCRRDAFKAVGGFSTSLFALEEVDFILRLKRYGRNNALKFKVFHAHPVETSGRKDELTAGAMFRLFYSNLMAIILFMLHYVLPPRLNQKLGYGMLGYWYGRRKKTD